MEVRQAYYISKLKDCLSLRQRTNPNYSLRAFARDLGVDSSTLSQIINGKRSIPAKNSRDLATKLNLSPKESTLFIESTNRSSTSIDNIKISPLDQRFMLDESYFKVIAEWEHYALLDLFDLTDFEPTTSYIMQKLDLTENRTEVVLNNLLTCGLLIRDEKGQLKKAYPDIRTTEDAKGEALNQAHLEELDLAKQKLHSIQKELRDYSSSTFAIDMNKMTEAKTIIREFRQKMTALLKNGEKTQVYMLAIQFFPLSQVDSDENA